MVQVLFGINYVVTKAVVNVFPPLVWASLRAVISALAMILFALLTKRPHPKGKSEYFLPLIGLALFGTVINQASFLVGLKYTTSTNAAILNTLIPVFTLLIVTTVGQEPLTLKRGIGFLLALVGVLILRKVENFTLSDETAIGDLLMIMNCLSYGIFLTISKKYFERYDRLWTTAWIFVYGSVGLTLLALPQWAQFEAPVMTGDLWAASVFAIFGGTLMTYFLNNWALAYTRTTNVAFFIYIQPIIAGFLSWWVYGDAITPRELLAGAFIFFAVFLVLRQDAKA